MPSRLRVLSWSCSCFAIAVIKASVSLQAKDRDLFLLHAPYVPEATLLLGADKYDNGYRFVINY